MKELLVEWMDCGNYKTKIIPCNWHNIAANLNLEGDYVNSDNIISIKRLPNHE